MIRIAIVIAVICSMSSFDIFGQGCGINYNYDAAGNRIKRYICVIGNPININPDNFALFETNASMDTSLFEKNVISSSNQNEISKIIVYPNPSSGIFQVDNLISSIGKYRVFDRTGRFVKEDAFEDEIDLTQLLTGEYFLLIYDNREIITVNVIIHN